ncbi:MAG TPA: hypothetical protein VGO56_15835 [Pyrinomonadaceae bacterium]|jgi:hypothetical protein|nr:hypothetical protein [Pyrinomonadaceae bacterium]
MHFLIYTLTILVLCLGLVFAWMIVRETRKVRESQEDILSIHTELERAVKLLDSPNDSQIIVGLQILSTMNEPEIRLKALPKIADLVAHSKNPKVVDQAQLVIHQVSLLGRSS